MKKRSVFGIRRKEDFQTLDYVALLFIAIALVRCTVCWNFVNDTFAMVMIVIALVLECVRIWKYRK